TRVAGFIPPPGPRGLRRRPSLAYPPGVFRACRGHRVGFLADRLCNTARGGLHPDRRSRWMEVAAIISSGLRLLPLRLWSRFPFWNLGLHGAPARGGAVRRIDSKLA